MLERILSIEEAATAACIQSVLDEMIGTGGRLVLPAMTLELDRGLQLHSGVTLAGQGPATVLRKGPGRVYPLSGYHNYGMGDVPLVSTDGLDVGMTVSIHDNRTHGGFYETFATITWIDGDWVGLDHGIEADYLDDESPCLTTVYPLVFGHQVEQVAVRDLCLEGNRLKNAKAMGGCRGGAVYFYQSRDIEITNIQERDYFGEGLSFQMCRDVVIKESQFDQNTGNGLHPGAGSTRVLFEDCSATGNEKSGFFFCVRANHITVRHCTFQGNDTGMSIGTRDCYNLIENCTMQDNRAAGLLIRQTPEPTEVHSCLIRDCDISGNAGEHGAGQVEIASAAHDISLVNNVITGHRERATAGVHTEEDVHNIYLAGNMFARCRPDLAVATSSLTDQPPQITCGYGAAPDTADRHLAFHSNVDW
jgi:hypothetical protein